MNPPDSLAKQLAIYSQAKEEDLEDLRHRALGPHSEEGALDGSLVQLARLAQGQKDLYPVLVETVGRYVEIMEREMDE